MPRTYAEGAADRGIARHRAASAPSLGGETSLSVAEWGWGGPPDGAPALRSGTWGPNVRPAPGKLEKGATRARSSCGAQSEWATWCPRLPLPWLALNGLRDDVERGRRRGRIGDPRFGEAQGPPEVTPSCVSCLAGGCTGRHRHARRMARRRLYGPTQDRAPPPFLMGRTRFAPPSLGLENRNRNQRNEGPCR